MRVLCVDDNRDAADSEAILLGVVGYDAKACYDGHTALQVAADFHPCIYLLDLNMPGMDGDELADKLREQPDGPQVLVAMTARSDQEARKRTAGFDQHLVKPVEPSCLLAVVSHLSHACQ